MSKGPVTSPFGRLLRLGGLVGRVGASVAGEQLVGLTRSRTAREARQLDNLVRNAHRIARSLGELKGAAMKVGQMASLHEGLLPPEVAAVLRSLQKEAPPIPFEVIEEELSEQLPHWRKLFAEIEPEAFAAASIGQVHRAHMRDGRRAAVKIQYPLIDRIIDADLGNLKRLLKTLVALVSEVDFEPIWRELSDRLHEELDYLHEAEAARRLAELHRDVPEIVIPAVIDEATTRTILTMEYVTGLPADVACSERFPQELRDRWGAVLFDFLLRGILVHRTLHADPNLANFSFLEEGRVVVYDFGCVKDVPAALSRSYAKLARAALDGRFAEVPAILDAMGVGSGDGPFPFALIEPFTDVVREILDPARCYRFGADDALYRRLGELKLDHLAEARTARFPRHIVFINRSIAGHFGNLSRLRAAADWRARLESHLRAAERRSRGRETLHE